MKLSTKGNRTLYHTTSMPRVSNTWPTGVLCSGTAFRAFQIINIQVINFKSVPPVSEKLPFKRM